MRLFFVLLVAVAVLDRVSAQNCTSSCFNGGVCGDKCKMDENDEFLKSDGTPLYKTSDTVNPIQYTSISFSYCFWINRRVSTDSTFLVSHLGAAGRVVNRHLLMGVSPDGTPIFAFYSNDLIISTYKQPLYSWTHYCGTYNRDTGIRTLYANGTWIGMGFTTSYYQGVGDLYIGYNGVPWGVGWLDEFRFYSRVLNDSDVSQIYMNQHCNNDKLEIYYRFEQSKGNASYIHDFSGNDRHAYATTLNNFNFTRNDTHPVYSVNTRQCICSIGWGGSNCTTVLRCSSKPCVNNGTCMETEGGYKCLCRSGYTGTNCSISVGKCGLGGCQNNATCIDRCKLDEGDGFAHFVSQVSYKVNDQFNPIRFNSTSFSYCFWQYRTHGFTPSTPIVHLGYTSGQAFENRRLALGIQPDGSPYMVFHGNDLVSTSYKQPLNSWTHYCGTYNRTTAARNLYANGTLVASNFATSPYIGVGELNIGVSGTSGFGSLDEFRLYSKVLSDDDVRRIYLNQYCDVRGLELYYRFEQTKGNTSVIYDFSGNERHAFVKATFSPAVLSELNSPQIQTEYQWQCNCTSGWRGSNCTTPIPKCESSPCTNGGSCIDTSTGSGFNCTCPRGFFGPTCQINNNLCASSPCKNGGECTDTETGYFCTCTARYEGVNCTSLVNFCASSPCQNGGACKNSCKGDLDDGHFEISEPVLYRWTNDGSIQFNQISFSYCFWYFRTLENNMFIFHQIGHLDGETPWEKHLIMGSSSDGSPTMGFLGDDVKADMYQQPLFSWAHLCGVYIRETKQRTLYADGVSVASDIAYSQYMGNGDFDIGFPGFGWGNGWVDEFKFFSKAIDPTIPYLIFTNQYCDNTGLEFYYRFDTSSLNAIQDHSGKNRHAVKVSNEAAVYSNVERHPVSEAPLWGCDCPTQFLGSTCSVNADACVASPCQNGGVCTDGIGSFTCQCRAGFTGADCSININECAINPCKNQGLCVDGINSYSCLCLARYTGVNCTDIVPSSTAGTSAATGGTGGNTATATATPPVTCAPGSYRYGPDCTLCNCLGNSYCNDGQENDGSCQCTAPGSVYSVEYGGCDCVGNWAGEDCNTPCLQCTPGAVCNKGTNGDGSCDCVNPYRMTRVNATSCECNKNWYGGMCLQDCPSTTCAEGETCQSGIYGGCKPTDTTTPGIIETHSSSSTAGTAPILIDSTGTQTVPESSTGEASSDSSGTKTSDIVMYSLIGVGGTAALVTVGVLAYNSFFTVAQAATASKAKRNKLRSSARYGHV